MKNKFISGIAIWILIFGIAFGVLYQGLKLNITWSLLDGLISVTAYAAFTLSFKFQAQFVEFQRSIHDFSGQIIPLVTNLIIDPR